MPARTSRRKRSSRTARAGVPPLRPVAPPRPVSRLSEAEREYAGARIFLSDDAGFALATATFDRPATRDGLMERLRADLAGEGVLLSTLDLRERPEEDVLVGLLEAHLAAEPTPAGQRRAVALINLETRLTYSDVPITGGLSGARDISFLELANFHRELFPKACPYPLLLWLTEVAETHFARNAPDLWHWRSARFDFERAGVDLSDFRAHPAERLEWFRHIAAASRRLGDKRAEIGGLLEQGIAEAEIGNNRDAIREWESALALAREIGDRRGETAALGNLGVAWIELNEPQRACEYFEKSLALARNIGDRLAESNALGGLGTAWKELGKLRLALEYHDQSLRICRQRRDRHSEGAALGNLGIVWGELGEPRRALSHHKQAFAIARSVGDRRMEGIALQNIALSRWALGEHLEAIARMAEALRVAEEVGGSEITKARDALAQWRTQTVKDAPTG